MQFQYAPPSSNPTDPQDLVKSNSEISRVLERDFQTSYNIPYGGDNNSQPGKFSPGSKARGAAKRDFASRQAGQQSTIKKPVASPFAEAFTVEPTFSARPGKNNQRMGGLFKRQIQPKPGNPSCAAGPRSITSVSATGEEMTTIMAYDGFKARLSENSMNHFTTKHGHKFGVDDLLPLDKNQKPTPHKQYRTCLNKTNRAIVRKEITNSLTNPTTTAIYTDVSIRGTNGRVYHDQKNGRIVAIPTEGKFAGQIIKAQPISQEQLKILRELKKI